MIFYIMGKSASGKDSLYKKLLESDLKLQRLVIYTTRPKRDGEEDGIEYNFVDESFLNANSDRIIEKRVYKTVFGNWYYATIDDGKIEDSKNYLVIGTLESYNIIKKYYGNEKVYPIYLEVSDKVRRERAIKRENMQKVPKFDEMERRFKADEVDFSDENVEKAGITKRYNNDDFSKCYVEVHDDIKKYVND
ncbi:MAG: guanylate kinase [Lachnospiraceae bacterium]|nr:guanylate kinase [Lachnospiraceae bacterium]